jgi:hypothetical protein
MIKLFMKLLENLGLILVYMIVLVAFAIGVIRI